MAGCVELFAKEGINTVAGLKGKRAAELLGKQIIGIVNFTEKKMGPEVSQAAAETREQDRHAALDSLLYQVRLTEAARSETPSPKFPASWENTGKFINFGL